MAPSQVKTETPAIRRWYGDESCRSGRRHAKTIPATATKMNVSICPAEPLNANRVKLAGPKTKTAEQIATTMTTRTIDRCGAWYLLSTVDNEVGSTRSKDHANTLR